MQEETLFTILLHTSMQYTLTYAYFHFLLGFRNEIQHKINLSPIWFGMQISVYIIP